MAGMNASWATIESPEMLWFEQAAHAGTYVGAAAFGIHATIFSIAAYYILKAKFSIRGTLWLVYLVVLLILGAINLSCNINFNELTWIDERNYPGGPLGFINEQQALPVNSLGNAAANAITLLVDSLIIYRCYVVWNTWIVIVVPSLMLLAAIIMAIFRTTAAAQPSASLLAATAVKFGIPYWSLSMALNMIVTILIVGRLWFARKRIQEVMGKGHGQMYTGVAAMVIESAAPYAISSFILIILYGLKDTGFVLLIPTFCQVQCISTALIIARVNSGRAWSTSTMTNKPSIPMSAIRFNTDSESPSTRNEFVMKTTSSGSGTRVGGKFSSDDGASILPM